MLFLEIDNDDNTTPFFLKNDINLSDKHIILNGFLSQHMTKHPICSDLFQLVFRQFISFSYF